MIRTRDGCGPAFPIHPDMPAARGCAPSISDAGMTLRDYFASAAMQGALASMAEGEEFSMTKGPRFAYEVADAMIKERAK